jgi:hypothetical protein
VAKLGQRDEAGAGRAEAAAVPVERAKFSLEVHVQPDAAGRLGLLSGHGDQPGAGAPVPQPAGHHGVQQERVRAAVPGHVDETSQFGAVPCAHPAQAVPG